ncbi:dockerin type I domain-containing protein [bacterium]|nr:dockerin type I domain-containing protein [bacterium]
MRQIERVVAATLAGVVVSSAAAQDAVQWRVEDGGNGHWYLHSDTSESWLWHLNQAEAVDASIASPSTQAENDFLYSLVQPTGLLNHWIGLVQAESAAEPSGGWGWLNGEIFDWANWGVGEPNNVGGVNENVAILIVNSGFPAVERKWQDYPKTGFMHASVYEWSADCNGDGIVDYGQILDGTFEDANANGVPDDCETMDDAGYEAAVMASGPIAYWRMEIEQGVVANHVTGSPAAVANGSPIVDETAVGCVDDRSLRMNGNSHLVVPDDDRFDLGSLGDFSVEAWVRLPALDDEMIVSRSRDVNAGNWDLRTYGNPGNLLLSIRLTYIAEAQTEWRPEWTDQWIHVVGTADDAAGTLSLHVNGVLESEVELGGPLAGSSNYPLLIGRHNIRGMYAWNAIGSIDEVAIYDRPLDADEILSHYMSADPTKSCDVQCIGDLNGDGVVGPPDLGILLAVWGTDGGDIVAADINGDGTVNASDLGPLLGAWGVCP